MSFKNLIAGAIFGTLFFIPLQAANIIIKNDGILSEKVAQKISIAGNELYEKTGILATIVALNDLNLTLDPKDPDLKLKVANAMRGKIAEFSANLPNPHALLFFTKAEHQVTIVNSDEISDDFDKDQILSPMPNYGTILPIFTSRKGEDVYNAGLLNGYFDIIEQIAKSRNIELENAIGNSNKIVLNFIRYFIYGSIILVLFITFYRKRKEENGEQKE